MSWAVYLALAVAILVAFHLLTALLWPPWKDIPREQFAHWINSIVRYYRDSAEISIVEKRTSLVLFRFRREGMNGNGCEVVMEVLHSPLLLSQHVCELVDLITREGYQAIVSDGAVEGEASIAVKVEVPDIWHMSAGNRAARLAHFALDVMGVDKEARFTLVPPNSKLRLRERTLEARKRQKEGLDLGGIGLRK